MKARFIYPLACPAIDISQQVMPAPQIAATSSSRCTNEKQSQLWHALDPVSSARTWPEYLLQASPTNRQTQTNKRASKQNHPFQTNLHHTEKSPFQALFRIFGQVATGADRPSSITPSRAYTSLTLHFDPTLWPQRGNH